MTTRRGVQTVLGPVDAGSLGVTLPHEHILVDATVYFRAPLAPEDVEVAYQPVSPGNISWVRSHRFRNKDSLRIADETLVASELRRFAQAGGKTVVDASSVGLGRNPAGLARVARTTGLNIIMGSGYYIADSYPEALKGLTEDEITQQVIREIRVGVDDTGIRAGAIGEVGCSFPLKDSERKVLRACAAAQHETGAALIIHPPGGGIDLIKEVINILDGGGADLERTVICHVDIMGFTSEVMKLVASRGCFLEIDTFGHLMTPVVMSGRVMDFPSESQRIAMVQQLIGEGYIGQVLLSQDTFLKELLTAFGGFGYAHILQDIVPVMLAKGITQQQIDVLTIENPQRLLQMPLF